MLRSIKFYIFFSNCLGSTKLNIFLIYASIIKSCPTNMFLESLLLLYISSCLEKTLSLYFISRCQVKSSALATAVTKIASYLSNAIITDWSTGSSSFQSLQNFTWNMKHCIAYSNTIARPLFFRVSQLSVRSMIKLESHFIFYFCYSYISLQ